MAKLFFNFYDGQTMFKDQEGFKVTNLDAGRDQVLRTLAKVTKEALPKDDDQNFQANVRRYCQEQGLYSYGEDFWNLAPGELNEWPSPRCEVASQQHGLKALIPNGLHDFVSCSLAIFAP